MRLLCRDFLSPPAKKRPLQKHFFSVNGGIELDFKQRFSCNKSIN